MEQCEETYQTYEDAIRTFPDQKEFQELIDIKLDGLSIWFVLMFGAGGSILVGIILSFVWCYYYNYYERFKNQDKRPQSHIPLGYQDQPDVIITHMTHDEVVAAHQSVTRNRDNIGHENDEPGDETVNVTSSKRSSGHEYDEPEDETETVNVTRNRDNTGHEYDDPDNNYDDYA